MATPRKDSTRPPIDHFLVALKMNDEATTCGPRPASRPSLRDAARPAAQPLCPRPRALRPIRGLLLEAGDILYDDTAWRRWLLRLLARLGLRAEYGPFFRVFDGDFLDEVHCGRKSFDHAMQAFLLSAGLSPGQAEETCRALAWYRRRSEADHRPLLGVRETLADLDAAGVALGLLCNSERPAEELRQRLTHLLGASPWRVVVSSHDLGCAMPAAACYAAALGALQLPASDVAFVGRDARELRGAKPHGLTTIAFNAAADAQADLCLQRFEDLLDLTRFSPARAAA